MKQVTGDLLALACRGDFDVIVHGCNCFNTMGAGIARSIRDQFPAAYAADCATSKGDRSKLGSFSSAVVKQQGHSFTVVNAYTQFDYRANGVNVDYGAISDVFAAIKCEFSGQRIGYPLIGAGLAGGDWTVIATIIDETLAGEDHTLVLFEPSQ